MRDKRVWPALIKRTTPEEQDRIDATLRTIGLTAEQRDRPAGALSHGQKQWLEIGMLLMQKPAGAARRRARRRHDEAGSRDARPSS